MEQLYNDIIQYITSAGRRIKKEAGTIADIGETKQYVTQEDLNIERGLKELI